jgi:hypothetical protein
MRPWPVHTPVPGTANLFCLSVSQILTVKVLVFTDLYTRTSRTKSVELNRMQRTYDVGQFLKLNTRAPLG